MHLPALRVRWIPLILLVPLGALNGRQVHVRAWPAFALFRKPGETRTVLVHHNRLRDFDGTKDSIAVLYELTPASDKQVAHCDSVPYLEVAEFEGPDWLGLADSTRLLLERPTRLGRYDCG